MSKPWQDDEQSLPYKMLGTLATISVETSEGQVVRCSAKYLLSHSYPQKTITKLRSQLKKHGLIQVSSHYHQLRGGKCADYIITPKGMDFIKKTGMNISTISWSGVDDTTDSAPKKKTAANKPKTEARIPEREPISFPSIMTEKEEKAVELLILRSKEVGSNGISVKRIVNPEDVLVAEGFAENHDAAEDIVCSLVQHSVLLQIAENEKGGAIRRTYSVQSIKVESVKTVSLVSLKEGLRQFLQETQAKMGRLFERRNTLRAERDQINVQISALDEEMERVFKEESTVREKLAEFNKLLHEVSRELSL